VLSILIEGFLTQEVVKFPSTQWDEEMLASTKESWNLTLFFMYS
jgi:hypothetical protein